MTLEVIVLAAGKGTRMRSALPKVLHLLAGQALLAHVVRTATSLTPITTHVIVGHEAQLVQGSLTGTAINWVVQKEQLGTGHAVSQALPHVNDASVVLILAGDVPLVTQSTLQACVDAACSDCLAVVTAYFDEPGSLGRIVRDEKDSTHIRKIVEFKDATPSEKAICEINSGIMALGGRALKELIGKLDNDNAQGEFYLTDIVALANQQGISVHGVPVDDAHEVSGINDRRELAVAERRYQKRLADDLMNAGVTLADPARLDVRGQVTAGEDCFIDVNVVLKGDVKLGYGVSIGSGVVIEDSILGDNVRVEPNTVIQGATISAGCTLGPFARLRPGTDLGVDVHIGNFVETKKAVLGDRTKAGHLAYLGDAILGADCNIGAGTITCNYDGVDKHQTRIGSDVFVGTNSTLVAPLVIDDGAFVAAGSTITTRVRQNELAVGRGKQRNIAGWTRPGKRKS
ncbi:MAG: bifunctional UDP-N-acetylglucosamine diphosphorylase/glucosamine-1-phosphate N-acetyltransferase GlmU [Proteobacteria bacterium]|nr:bifunctional UDP-N-acetylglucosamine diphosphorylase/glucosamine-1-phosphate N-acetyltransferase GlmU [Pseudomonadota bacterium]